MTAAPAVNFNRACPVCGGLGGENLSPLNFAVYDGSPLSGAFDLVACRDCGLTFYDLAEGPETVEAYYRFNAYYATSSTPGAGGQSPEDLVHQRDIVARLAPFAPPAAFTRTVCDLGCGRGGLLEELRRAGYRSLLGVDLLPESVSAVKSRGLPAAEGSAAAPPLAGLEPGLLIYSHVLEHLWDPAGALAEARRHLEAQGLIYVEVPDASTYEADIPFQQLYLEHLNHFDPAALAALLSRAGFAPLALARGRFPLPGGRSIGIIWAVARPASTPAPAVFPAGEARAALPDYLAASRAHPALALIAELAENKKPLQIWGLSQMTMLLMGSSPLARANVHGFIDRDPFKLSRTVRGLPVRPPESLTVGQSGDDVLLTVWGQAEPMRRQLSAQGFAGRVWSLSD